MKMTFRKYRYIYSNALKYLLCISLLFTMVLVKDVIAQGLTLNGTNTITTNRGTTQLQALDRTTDVSSTATWTVSDTLLASVSSSGLVSAIKNGIVTVTSSISGRSGTIDITITNQAPTLTITGTNEISILGGTSQLSVADGTIDVSTQTIWSLDDTTKASIDNTGLVRALLDGTVTATATISDKSGTFNITITNQTQGVVISAERKLTTVNIGEMLSMKAKDMNDMVIDVRWSLKADDGVTDTTLATIDNLSGVITVPSFDKGGKPGVIIVKAVKSTDNAVEGSLAITITSPTTTYRLSINTTPRLDSSVIPTIDTPGGKLQMTVTANPNTAAGFLWSIWKRNPLKASEKILSTDATITQSGSYKENIEITAIRDNTVFIRVALKNNSTIVAEQQINISNQNYTPVVATSVNVSPTGIAAAIKTYKGKLQMTAEVLPTDTSDKTVSWSIISGDAIAIITDKGILESKGDTDGQVTVRATVVATPTITKDAIVQVTNTRPITDVQSISLINDSSKPIVVGENFTLRVAIYPITASDQSISWKVSDENYISIVNASTASFAPIRVTGNNDVTIQAISSSNPKIVSEPYTIVIEENPNSPSPPLGIPQNELDAVSVYPNPASDYIIIKMKNDIEKQQYNLLNSLGLQVSSGVLNFDKQVDISRLPKGVYILNLGDTFHSYRIIKK